MAYYDFLGECSTIHSSSPGRSALSNHLSTHLPTLDLVIPESLTNFDFITDHFKLSGIIPFNFKKPSPDDIALSKQSQAFNPPTKKVPEKKKGPIIVMPPKVIEAPKTKPVTKKPVAQPKLIRQMLSSIRESTLKKISNDKRNPDVHICIMGNELSGKSTLVGHMLFLADQVDKKFLDKCIHEANKLGRESCQYALIVDKSLEERQRGHTLDVSHNQITTKMNQLILIDCPGDSSLVSTNIHSIVQSQVSLIVIDGGNESYHSLAKGDITPFEYIRLSRTLGIKQIIMAINKMDTTDWNESRYNDFKKILSQLTSKAGYIDSQIHFIPICGLTGDNLMTPFTSSWYKGQCLLEVLSNVKYPQLSNEEPFCMSIDNVFDDYRHNTIITGMIDQGFVTIRDKVSLLPSMKIATIKSISHNGGVDEYAIAGWFVQLTISPIDEVIAPGQVICNPEHPLLVSNQLRAHVKFFELETPLIRGSSVFLYLNQTCVVATLIDYDQMKSTTEEKKHVRLVKSGCTLSVNIKTEYNIIMDLFATNKQYGRFILRSENKTIGAGAITEVLSKV